MRQKADEALSRADTRPAFWPVSVLIRSTGWQDAHLPDQHVCPAPHAFPQLPQLAGSVSSSMHAPPHSDTPSQAVLASGPASPEVLEASLPSVSLPASVSSPTPRQVVPEQHAQIPAGEHEGVPITQRGQEAGTHNSPLDDPEVPEPLDDPEVPELLDVLDPVAPLDPPDPLADEPLPIEPPASAPTDPEASSPPALSIGALSKS